MTLEQTAAALVALLKAQNKTVTTAESLTGGLVAQTITTVPGASSVFGYGFVTYAELAKARLLGVDPKTIEKFTVVSAPVAAQMARGALTQSGAQLALALTGLAGPDGGTAECPVGTVYISAAVPGTTWVHRASFGNPGRQQVRELAAQKALELGLAILRGEAAPADVMTETVSG